LRGGFLLAWQHRGMVVRGVTAKTRIFQLKIQLREVRPPVWRRVLVPGEMTLADLHTVVQIAMGWTDSHLHEFDIDGARYGLPVPDWGLDEVADESRVKLFRVAREGSRLRYAYDFGDGWEHDVVVEKVLSLQPGTRYPCCIGGRRACPPEDVGGPWGYQDFLAAVADTEHDEHEQWIEWVGGGFDSDAFDIAAADKALDVLAFAEAPVRRAGPTS
jgi:hypothetical protein